MVEHANQWTGDKGRETGDKTRRDDDKLQEAAREIRAVFSRVASAAQLKAQELAEHNAAKQRAHERTASSTRETSDRFIYEVAQSDAEQLRK